jgi:hypothetical protein
MSINNKFQIGECVYVIYNNSPYSVCNQYVVLPGVKTIMSIEVEDRIGKPNQIVYTIDGEGDFDEEYVLETYQQAYKECKQLNEVYDDFNG